jgi:5'(3')-deoxyribonucleotidase
MTYGEGKTMNKRPKVILCDLDGVLADFNAGAAEVHGWTLARLYEKWPPGIWEMTAALGLSDEDEFWEPIDQAGEAFWLGLQPLPWARTLYAYLESIAEVHVATAPSRCDSCYSGKVKWLKRFFGRNFTQFVITPHKHIFAQPGALLIDDRELNINQFVQHGGDGIIFPARCNGLYNWANNPVAYLQRLIGDF